MTEQPLESRGAARTINKSSTPATANPEPSDVRTEDREMPGGESGVPAATQDVSVSPAFNGKYVARCPRCAYLPHKHPNCMVCGGSQKVIRERKPTDMNSVTLGPADANAPLGPVES